MSAVFSADGRRVVTASGDTTARVWDLGGPSPTAIVLVGHRDPVLTAAFSPDGRRLVTASGDTTARIWDLGGQPPAAVVLEAQRAPLLGATFSPDGRRVLTVSSDDVVRLWPYVPDAVASSRRAREPSHAASPWPSGRRSACRRPLTAPWTIEIA